MTESGKTSEEIPAPKYEVVFTQDARNDIGALDGGVKKQLEKLTKKKIAVNPEGYGTPLSSSLSGYWKHELANHRLVHQILPEEKKIVVVCAVGPRDSGLKMLGTWEGFTGEPMRIVAASRKPARNTAIPVTLPKFTPVPIIAPF